MYLGLEFGGVLMIEGTSSTMHIEFAAQKPCPFVRHYIEKMTKVEAERDLTCAKRLMYVQSPYVPTNLRHAG